MVVVCSVFVLGVRGVGRKGAVVERAFEVWEEGQQEGEGPTLDQGQLRMHREGCALEKCNGHRQWKLLTGINP